MKNEMSADKENGKTQDKMKRKSKSSADRRTCGKKGRKNNRKEIIEWEEVKGSQQSERK